MWDQGVCELGVMVTRIVVFPVVLSCWGVSMMLVMSVAWW